MINKKNSAMIQRKQSLFLLLSALLTGLTLLFPFVEFTAIDGTISIHAFEINDNNSGLLDGPVSILTMGVSIIIITVLSLISIFLYSKRLLQIRLIRYAIILKFAVIAVLVYFSYILTETEVELLFTPKEASLFIVLAFLFDIFAIRGIRKDEALIRSVDRIR